MPAVFGTMLRLRVEVVGQEVDGSLFGGGGDFVGGMGLDERDEIVVGVGGVVGAPGGGDAIVQAGKGGAVIRVAVDDHQRARRDQGEHGRAIELGGDAGDDAVVEGLDKRGI